MSASVTISLEGVQDAIRSLGAWELQKRGAVMKILAGTAYALDREVKYLLSTPGTGNVYRSKRKGSKVWHVASLPGMPPAVDLGDLRRSYHVRRPGPMTYEVGSELQDKSARGLYRADILEKGTRDGRIKPRPHLQPAWDKVRPQFIADVIEELSR
jgi:hypothetical protein